MPSTSDHDRRDAWAASQAELRIAIGPYLRRMFEMCKGDIQETLEEAVQNGEPVNGTEIGRVAAAKAIATYIGTGGPTPAIESSATEAPPSDD
jgi:hypothetical protein